MLNKTFTVFTSRSCLLATSFLLAACSGHSPSDSPGSARGSDGEYIGWHCQGEIESADNWNCSKQLLRGGSLVPPIEVEVEAVEPIVLKPAEIALDTSLSETDLAAGKTPTHQVASEKVPVFDISANGYTVQLGAYLSQDVAEQAADNIRLAEGELRVRTIVDGERYLFVLVYGQYQSRQQAEIVTEQLTELNPDLNYWIRTIESMRKPD